MLRTTEIIKAFHNVGIGGVTALKLIQKHKRLEDVLASMEGGRYDIPDPFPYEEARRLFNGEVTLLHASRHRS